MPIVLVARSDAHERERRGDAVDVPVWVERAVFDKGQGMRKDVLVYISGPMTAKDGRTIEQNTDPVLVLSNRITDLFHGHTHRDIIAALAATLGYVLECGATADEPPAARELRYTLRQVAAEILHARQAFTRES